jgi:hypothetical protein
VALGGRRADFWCICSLISTDFFLATSFSWWDPGKRIPASAIASGRHEDEMAKAGCVIFAYHQLKLVAKGCRHDSTDNPIEATSGLPRRIAKSRNKKAGVLSNAGQFHFQFKQSTRTYFLF